MNRAENLIKDKIFEIVMPGSPLMKLPDVLESMKEIAWQAWKEAYNDSYATEDELRKVFEKWFNEQLSESGKDENG